MNKNIANEIRCMLPFGDDFTDEQIFDAVCADFDNLANLRNALEYNETYTPYEEDIQTIDHNLDYLEVFIRLFKGDK